MMKIDKKVLLLILLAGYGLFYWYELRPAQIRHDCSWYKVVDAAIPAISKEEAEASKVEYDRCVEKNKIENKGTMFEGMDDLGCHDKLKYERGYTPEKTWYREAKDKEYDFCIHEKGL